MDSITSLVLSTYTNFEKIILLNLPQPLFLFLSLPFSVFQLQSNLFTIKLAYIYKTLDSNVVENFYAIADISLSTLSSKVFKI